MSSSADEWMGRLYPATDEEEHQLDTVVTRCELSPVLPDHLDARARRPRSHARARRRLTALHLPHCQIRETVLSEGLLEGACS